MPVDLNFRVGSVHLLQKSIFFFRRELPELGGDSEGKLSLEVNFRICMLGIALIIKEDYKQLQKINFYAYWIINYEKTKKDSAYKFVLGAKLV
jgi:hypothetical protein